MKKQLDRDQRQEKRRAVEEKREQRREQHKHDNRMPKITRADQRKQEEQKNRRLYRQRDREKHQLQVEEERARAAALAAKAAIDELSAQQTAVAARLEAEQAAASRRDAIRRARKAANQAGVEAFYAAHGMEPPKDPPRRRKKSRKNPSASKCIVHRGNPQPKAPVAAAFDLQYDPAMVDFYIFSPEKFPEGTPAGWLRVHSYCHRQIPRQLANELSEIAADLPAPQPDLAKEILCSLNQAFREQRFITRQDPLYRRLSFLQSQFVKWPAGQIIATILQKMVIVTTNFTKNHPCKL